MSRRYLGTTILLLAGVLSLPVAAHDSGIYESMEHIHIGRVFLTPDEREHLDAIRKIRAPGPGVSRTAADGIATARKERAAGYIVSSSGRARVWKNGDFVLTDALSSVRFPGEVEITRTADEVPDTDDAPIDNTSSPNVETADDAN